MELQKGDILSLKIPTTSREPRLGKESKILTRVYRRLAEQGKNPGKVVLLVLREDQQRRVIGAFTENQGGSISFFPDYVELLDKQHLVKNGKIHTQSREFDHITLNRVIEKRGHATNAEAKHFLKHDPAKFADGVGLAWFTLTTTNTEKWNDLPKELTVDIAITEPLTEILSYLQESFRGAIELEFPSTPTPDRFGCIQFILVDKNTGPQMKFLKDVFETDFFTGVKDVSAAFSNGFLYQTSNDFGYDISIHSFNLEGQPRDDQFLIVSTSNLNNPGH